ncbi:hypothetical protein BJ166DRAFT_529656 [Pestalotiopsis sp. NC0098]|nr:hypothetical protein BJ166DRAFT_529656 [Pestalotiopsis sp. NC0098]
MLGLRKCLYVLATIPALGIVVTGTLAKQNDQMMVGIATVLWIVLFSLFVWLSFLAVAKDSRFIITCFYYLVCVGATMSFFVTLRAGDRDTLFLWIPIGTQMGIFLGSGIYECIRLISWRGIRDLMLSFLDGLRLLMGAEEVRLPTHEPYAYNSSPARPAYA